jgi:hypothetical protein
MKVEDTLTTHTLSLPKILLHGEGLAGLAVAVAIYSQYGGSWWLFAALLFAPDLSMLGYLAGTRVGAVAYNALHTWILPAVLVGIGHFADVRLLVLLGLILAAHIGLDRSIGYGLKYPDAFKETHLGRV